MASIPKKREGFINVKKYGSGRVIIYFDKEYYKLGQFLLTADQARDLAEQLLQKAEDSEYYAR